MDDVEAVLLPRRHGDTEKTKDVLSFRFEFQVVEPEVPSRCLRSSSITEETSSLAPLMDDSTVWRSMAGLMGLRLLVQYTPCWPTRMSASVSRSMVTARRPRATPIMNSCFSSSSL